MDKSWSVHDNLRHVLYDTCTDPDCELHNPDVAMREEVMSTTDLAFFIAGAQFSPWYTERLLDWARNVLEEQTKEAKTK